MGGPMAQRLLANGFALAVHDPNPEAANRLAAAGAEVLDSPAGVADAADAVFMCLPSPDVVREVALGQGGLIGGRRARYAVDLSTTGPRVARDTAAALAGRGIAWIDAPITGGIAKARSGELTIILGAPDADIAALRPALECLGGKLVVAGASPGDGQMLKVINNLLSFVALEATAEAMALGVRAGLDPEAMLETFNNGSGRNSATEEKFPRAVMTRRFDFGFPIRGVCKDLSLCLAEAQALGVPMPASSSVFQIWSLAMAERGDEDMTAIVKLFERWAGVEIRGGDAAG